MTASRCAPPLPPGGRVGVIAPSSPPSEAMLKGTIEYWRDRGYDVVCGANVRAELGGYLAGSAAARADDLNTMLRDPSVDLVVAANGGWGAAQLLPLIDYAAFSASPMLVMGMSDSSILTQALYARTGVVTFDGPTGNNFAELGLPPYTEDAMFAALESTEPLGELPKHSPWTTLRGGNECCGHLLGGHLGTVRSLLGTPFEPVWQGAILFIEEVAVELHDVDRSLTHFKLAGVLDQIAGLVVGRCIEVEEKSFKSDETLDQVVLRVCEGFDFPIISNVDFGHTEEKLTLAVGAQHRLVPGTADLFLEEPPTAPRGE